MIIPFKSTSFSDIKKSIVEYLEANKDRYGIIDNYEGSVRTMIVDLLAGFATYLNYKVMMSLQNARIDTALSDRTVLKLATERYGYNFNRNVSPKLRLIYNENNAKTKIVMRGDSIGTISIDGVTYDLVYIGKGITLQPGDSIEVAIGIKSEMTGNFFDFDFEKTIEIRLLGENGLDVDNDSVFLFIDDREVETTKDPENFIVDNKPLIKSVYYNEVSLMVYDYANEFGFEINPNDTYKVIYLSSFGRYKNLYDALKTLKIDNQFYFDGITSFGFDRDSISKIRFIAPFYYTTSRVMSNELSHRIISTAYSGVLDCAIKRREDKCCEIDFWPLLQGSGKTPMEFTLADKLRYIEYLSRYKFVGVKLTEENIKTPSVRYEDWDIYVKIDCSITKNVEDINADIYSYIVQEVLPKFVLKLGESFTIGEVLSEISKYKYMGREIIEDVHIYERGGDVAYAPNREIELAFNEYFYTEISIDIGCR